jgi:steroid delta-isomerase-like uncharacterized protein
MKESTRLFTIIVFILTLVLFGFSISCQRQVQEGITEEEVQAWTDNVLKMWNEANLNIVDKVYTPEIVRHDCGQPEAIVGLENIKKYLKNLFNAFPDLNITVEETIAVGNKLAQRWTLSGTNTGSMADMPPTGKNVRVSGVSIIHMVNGKAIEIWDFYNVWDMYQQLGFTLIPPQEQSEQ